MAQALIFSKVAGSIRKTVPLHTMEALGGEEI
jgi:hypothetical protein